MNDVLQNLLKLQTLEFDSKPEKVDSNEVKLLREKIPQPILGDYDRLRAREKRGLALVRNNVCAGCHMVLPVGVVATLMHGNDIQICDNCGRYLYLCESAQLNPALDPPIKKSKIKPNKRNMAAHAVP